MKTFIVTICILFSLSVLTQAQTRDAFNQSLPPSTLLKPSLTIRAVRDLNYWKQPNLKNFWSWMPKLEFEVSGPIDDASYFTYEFFTPDGKPWFSLDTAPFSIAENDFRSFESEAVPRWTDKRSTILTGVFPFKITLKNSLQNTSKLFYQGKFKIGKQFAGTPNPDFKNQNIFYVDRDWCLPLAYLNFDAKQNPDSPQFQVGMWFRGDFNGKVVGYLYYNGKQIANSEENAGIIRSINTIGDADSKFRYEYWQLNFFKARLFDTNGNFKTAHIFKQNPGTYELKVLVDGELARTANFTVGADGKIIDNDVSINNGLSGFGLIIPVKVTPVKEGAVNVQAWKTEAFYGNLLTGFDVP